MLITGKKIGETFVQVGDLRIPIFVLEAQTYKTWQQLTSWLKGKRGLELKVSPRAVELSGRLLRLRDYKSLATEISSDMSYRFTGKIPEDLHAPITDFVHEQLEGLSLTKGDLSFSPRLVYTLPQTEETPKKLYEKALNPLGIEVAFNKYRFAKKPLIRVQVYIAQVSQRFFRHYGLQWPGEVQGEVIKEAATDLGVNGQFQFGAHMLEQSGLGQVLASPTLTTKSGTKANFHSGGEYPIPTQSAFQSQVQWKKHGILLEVKPEVDHQGRMDIEVQAEISLLDHSKAQNGIPAIEKSEVHSTFQWLGRKPIVLSGLLKKRWSDNSEGLPLLRQIPILSPLFSHQSKTNDQTELVFLIQAQVLDR